MARLLFGTLIKFQMVNSVSLRCYTFKHSALLHLYTLSVSFPYLTRTVTR